jgi:hypothetical protein
MNVPVWKRLALVWLVVVSFHALASCTITPRIVRPPDASFDGTQKNSGFLGWTDDGQGIITARARARFNELVRLHGHKFLPALAPDYGITPGATNGQWLITQEALVKFQTMNRWQKSVPK